MQYQFKPLIPLARRTRAWGFLVSLIIFALTQTVVAADLPLFYFAPSSGPNSSIQVNQFSGKVVSNIPSSAWEPAVNGQSHFGFQNQAIILKLKVPPGTAGSQVLSLHTRYLEKVVVHSRIITSHQDKATIIDNLSSMDGIGFSSKKFFKIPDNTQELYIIAIAKGPLIVPLDILSDAQAQHWRMGSIWALGIFFGLVFFAILKCAFQYQILKQSSIAVVCFFILILALYVGSQSGLHHLSSLPLHYLENLAVQICLLCALAIAALYIQLYSHTRLGAEAPSKTLSYLFQSSIILILTPLIAYAFIIDMDIKLTIFQVMHLPAIVLAFLIAAIASSVAHKRHPEQGYLLLTWLFSGVGIMFEGAIFFNVDHTRLLPVADISDLPSIFYSLTIIFICFWAMTHESIVYRARIEALQVLFDKITQKNKTLEINHARFSDLAQNIFKEIKLPADKIVQALQLAESLSQALNYITPHKATLNEALRKLTLLNQDLSQSLSPQQLIFELHSLLARLPLTFQQRARAHGVHIQLEIDQYLPAQAKGDQSLLYKALILIIEHRLSDLRHGSIHIVCKRANDARSPQVHLAISIIDSGTEFDRDSIDRFWSSSPTLGSHEFQLILARDMIIAMGGEFAIEFDPNQGNNFSIRVKLEKVVTNHAPTTNNTGKQIKAFNSGAQGKHALIITEHRQTLEPLLSQLAQQGIQRHVAQNIQEAIAILLIEKIDVILLDVDRASTEAGELINQIQVLNNTIDVPVLAVSGKNEHMTQAINAGASHFLEIPSSIHALEKILSTL